MRRGYGDPCYCCGVILAANNTYKTFNSYCKVCQLRKQRDYQARNHDRLYWACRIRNGSTRFNSDRPRMLGDTCSYCKDVLVVSNAIPRKAPREGVLSYCRVCHNKQVRARDFACRNRVLTAYGNVCACCGEARYEFLALDHVNNDGAAEKKAIGGRKIYRHVEKLGFPKDRYQILCHNCNCAKGFYGACPHVKEREMLVA